LKGWREQLVAPRVRLMADLGEAIMDDAFVEAAAYIFDPTIPTLGQELLTFDVRTRSDKVAALTAMTAFADRNNTHIIRNRHFLALPNTKILYSLTPSIL